MREERESCQVHNRMVTLQALGDHSKLDVDRLFYHNDLSVNGLQSTFSYILVAQNFQKKFTDLLI